MTMKKRYLLCSTLIVLLSGCGLKPATQGTVLPTPTEGVVRVVTVAPVVTETPAPITVVVGTPSKVKDLSGKYEITFPSCFDSSTFETGEDFFRTIYKSSAYPDLTFTVTYALKDSSVNDTDTNNDKKSFEITLPTAYFKEGAEGYSEVILSVSLRKMNISSSQLFTFSITEL
jgi:hypothetical protein